MSRFSTPLTQVEEDTLVVGGRDVADIVERFSFVDMVALTLGVELDDGGRELLRACLVVNPDHGLASNATTAARAVTATTRSALTHGVAAGVLAVGDVTISPRPVMRYLAAAAAERAGRDAGEYAEQLVAHARHRRLRIPGFGSPLHPAGDPRVAPLREVARRSGRWGEHCELFEAIGAALAATGRHLPANEVGMTGACLADLGLSEDQGEGVALIGLMPSLVANVLLELAERPRFLVAQPLFEEDGR